MWGRCTVTIGVIIQARTGSTRFPRKIYEDINGKTTLCRTLEGVNQATMPSKIILAMPKGDKLEYWKRQNDTNTCIDSRFIDPLRFETYFGSENDLVDRYFQAARMFGISLIVRITADCPLIQGKIIDEMLIEYFKKGYNGYMTNIQHVAIVQYPNGMDVEIFPYWMLAEANIRETNLAVREHVGAYFYGPFGQYPLYGFNNRKPHSTISMKFKDFSFDTYEDFRLIDEITKHYDEHGELDRAIIESNFQIREWNG